MIDRAISDQSEPFAGDGLGLRPFALAQPSLGG
jgi:hypothetical protein